MSFLMYAVVIFPCLALESLGAQLEKTEKNLVWIQKYYYVECINWGLQQFAVVKQKFFGDLLALNTTAEISPAACSLHSQWNQRNSGCFPSSFTFIFYLFSRVQKEEKNSQFTQVSTLFLDFPWKKGKNTCWCFGHFLARGTGREIHSLSID